MSGTVFVDRSDLISRPNAPQPFKSPTPLALPVAPRVVVLSTIANPRLKDLVTPWHISVAMAGCCSVGGARRLVTRSSGLICQYSSTQEPVQSLAACGCSRGGTVWPRKGGRPGRVSKNVCVVSNSQLCGAESRERYVAILVDTRDKLVLHDGTVPVPIPSVLLGTPGTELRQRQGKPRNSPYLSKSRPHRWMRVAIKKMQ